MTRQRCDLVPLATWLLVVMVGVASASAKPAAAAAAAAILPSEENGGSRSSSSSSPSSSSENEGSRSSSMPSSSSYLSSSSASAPSPSTATNDSSEDYYYYDYDYDYYSEGLPQRPLNMSEFHLPNEEEEGAPHVPRYMLELYADETSRKPKHQLPSARHDLVRSFIASSSESSNPKTGDKDNDDNKSEDRSRGRVARIHSLSFNVSLPRREKVNSATLRLYALITRDQYTYIGVERRVRILMEVYNTSGDGSAFLLSICERDVYEVQNTWETFDVTTAVKYWLAHHTGSQILQIHIESVFSTAGDGGDLDVATAPRTDSEPLLLVYSMATPHQMAKRELKLMISHEYDDDEDGRSVSQKRRLADERRGPRTKRSMAEEQEEESNRIYEGDDFTDDLPTYAFSSLEGRRRPTGRKRRAKNSCKRKPLKVDFKDIGWDKWIIAPPSYEAYQCSGKCFYPLASHLSPTKHAVVQNLVHSLHPDRASRACCVPTKLGPISLLYVENGTPTYEYGYNDMVVLECGCR